MLGTGGHLFLMVLSGRVWGYLQIPVVVKVAWAGWEVLIEHETTMNEEVVTTGCVHRTCGWLAFVYQ